MCLRFVCMHLSGFFQAITSIFMHRYQHNLAQLFSFTSRNAIQNICSVRLKAKVTLEGQMIEWS